MSGHPDDDSLAAYVEQRAANRDAIEEHLDGCEACRVVVAHLGALGAALDPAPIETGPALETAPMTNAATLAEPGGGASLFGPPLPRGARVDRYVVDGELGRGGMGVVLAAHDPELDRTIALKIVRPGSRDESARARLLREARAMARLSHPNVVAIHDVGELDDGRVFLAMEHVRGTTLRRVIAEKDRPFARTMELFLQAGRGLAAAHAIVEGWGARRAAMPFVVVGMNSLLVYVLSGVLNAPLRAVLRPAVGAAGAALVVLAAKWALCAWLYRKRLFFRV